MYLLKCSFASTESRYDNVKYQVFKFMCMFMVICTVKKHIFLYIEILTLLISNSMLFNQTHWAFRVYHISGSRSVSFLPPASLQCHRGGAAHEAPAAWQQHGQQHGLLQSTDQVEPGTEAGPASPGRPKPEQWPASAEPGSRRCPHQSIHHRQQHDSSSQRMWVENRFEDFIYSFF